MALPIQTKTIARVLLGALYLTFGLNFFLHFLPMPPPNEAMGKILGAMFETGYWFPFIKITEIVFGALILAGLFVPLSLVVLAPVTLNIVLMHGILDPSGIGAGLVILVLHIYVGLSYLKYYRPMLAAKTE